MAWPNPSVSAGTAQTATSGTVSWSHTVGAGANKLLVLVGTGTTGGADAVTGVTYNSISCTRLQTTSDGAFERVQIWQLNSPTTGTNTVAVTYSSGSTVQIFACAISFDGAATTNGAVSTNTAATANPSVTVADSANGDVVISILATDEAGATTTQNGTLIGEAEDVGVDSDFNGQYQTATGANTVCSWANVDSGATWIAMGVAIKQGAAAQDQGHADVFYIRA